MRIPLEFFVTGEPKTAGSKRAFPIKKNGHYTGRVAVTDSCAKSKDWKAVVAHEAVLALDSAPKFRGALAVSLVFHMPRPKYHHRKNGTLKPTSPALHECKPDVLKLTRAVEDALTGIMWEDDSQIAIEILRKQYVAEFQSPGVRIAIREATES